MDESDKRDARAVTIVDYRAGNLTSVKLAFGALGVAAHVTRDPREIAAAERLVFPGVGAAQSAMDNLRALGLVDCVRDFARSGRPFLGICLGMQILFAHSAEDGGVDMLGLFDGQVRRFPDAGDKVPAIGWNQVRMTQDALGVRNDSAFYFVHSYCADIVPETVGVTEYAGVRFTSIVRRGRLWACQFHPEKSGRVGLDLLKEWLSC